MEYLPWIVILAGLAALFGLAWLARASTSGERAELAQKADEAQRRAEDAAAAAEYQRQIAKEAQRVEGDIRRIDRADPGAIGRLLSGKPADPPAPS